MTDSTLKPCPCKVAALFVIKNGTYFNNNLIDPWDIDRDARNYSGPYPVVAHPPCQRWGKMAKVNYARWGGEHNKLGNDNGCFKSALDSVNRWGGVLEHPASTYAWKEFNLTKPVRDKWVRSGDGWVCVVWQSAYGHKANKSTWLYYYSPNNIKPFDMNWERPIGKYQIGRQDQRGKNRNKPTLNSREANETPMKFKDVLLELAMNTRTPTQDKLGRLLKEIYALRMFGNKDCIAQAEEWLEQEALKTIEKDGEDNERN